MRTGTAAVNWLVGDHLGSTALTVNDTGLTVLAELRYKAWGENRYTFGTTPTTFKYTGQRHESALGGLEGLYFYNARWYDPAVGRFLQADSIVPGADNPQSWNRYSYVKNNPLKYIDPSGHMECDDVSNCGGNGGIGTDDNDDPTSSDNESATADNDPKPLDDGLVRVFFVDPDYYSFSIYSDALGKWLLGALAIPASAEPSPAEELAILFFTKAVGGGVTITIDRYGRVYISPGISIGRTIMASESGLPSMSIMAGTLNTPESAKPEQIESLLTGLGFNHGLGAIWGHNAVWSPTSQYHATETGIVWPPQINIVTASYGIGPIEVGDLFSSP